MDAVVNGGVRTVAEQQGALDECNAPWTTLLEQLADSSFVSEARAATLRAIADHLSCVRASPSQVAPANPAQVTDEMVEAHKLLLWAADSFDAHAKTSDGHPEEIEAYKGSAEMYRECASRFAAAIGAGGQAIAWKDATGTELHRLILNYQKEDMIASGGRPAERAANYSIPLYTQPRPADERMVEALPQKIRDQEIQWAVGRWRAEVENRPLVNVHRRSLDDSWRQVIRHFGGDPEALCGPAHDELLELSTMEGH